jgi:hypothetical protein
MNEQMPDFYLTSSEDHRLNQPRKCYRVRRFPANRRDDYLLIRISPPIEGRNFGLGDIEVSEVVIASRHNGVSLFPVKKWPISVYLLHTIVQNPAERTMLRENELTLIGWAEIYDTLTGLRSTA